MEISSTGENPSLINEIEKTHSGDDEVETREEDDDSTANSGDEDRQGESPGPHDSAQTKAENESMTFS